MSGFEGYGDFDSDDPFERYVAHQAAKGNLPSAWTSAPTVRVCLNCGATGDGRAEPICNNDGLVGPHRWADVA